MASHDASLPKDNMLRQSSRKVTLKITSKMEIKMKIDALQARKREGIYELQQDFKTDRGRLFQKIEQLEQEIDQRAHKRKHHLRQLRFGLVCQDDQQQNIINLHRRRQHIPEIKRLGTEIERLERKCEEAIDNLCYVDQTERLVISDILDEYKCGSERIYAAAQPGTGSLPACGQSSLSDTVGLISGGCH